MLVEYGHLEVDLKKGIMIACTAPIGIIEKLSKLNEDDVKMIVDKKNKVFVDVPDNIFDDSEK